jgi:hypothetical protein
MKDDAVMDAMCRDGVLAKIKKVPYYGEGNGFVFSGTRESKLSLYDKNGEPNEGPDIWTLSGMWRYNSYGHPFDLVAIKKKDLLEQEYPYV